jgi:hypothetical protein
MGSSDPFDQDGSGSGMGMGMGPDDDDEDGWVAVDGGDGSSGYSADYFEQAAMYSAYMDAMGGRSGGQ